MVFILRPFSDQVKNWVSSDAIIDHHANVEHEKALSYPRLRFKTTIEPKLATLRF